MALFLIINPYPTTILFCPELISIMLFRLEFFMEAKYEPWPEVTKLFSYSTQLSTKFILLINVKMAKIVGILTFISVINIKSERLKSRNFFICRYFSVYEQLKFCAQLSEHDKCFITAGPDHFKIMTLMIQKI